MRHQIHTLCSFQDVAFASVAGGLFNTVRRRAVFRADPWGWGEAAARGSRQPQEAPGPSPPRGLAVSIPCYAGHNYLVGRVNSIVLDMEQVSSEILNIVSAPQ